MVAKNVWLTAPTPSIFDMPLAFVTTNKHKFQEAQAVLLEYGVELEHVNMSYAENHDLGLEEIARTSAEQLAKDLNRAVVTEDTGIFFAAYDGFPGALPKFVFNTLGYKGIMRLLAGEGREAYFRAVVAYAEPGKPAMLFDGFMRGVITEQVHDPDKDVQPYERIFIPDGSKAPLSAMTRAEKNTLSHRGAAFRKLGEYLKKKAGPDEPASIV